MITKTMAPETGLGKKVGRAEKSRKVMGRKAGLFAVGDCVGPDHRRVKSRGACGVFYAKRALAVA